MLLAAIFLGTWVSRKIEAGVVQNYGTASALFFDSLIPQLPSLQTPNRTFDPNAAQELRQIFVDGVLSQRVVTYKVWSDDGEILSSYDQSLEGRIFPVSEALESAWNGVVAAEFETINFHAVLETATIELPLFGVYVPIRNLQTGEVVSVIEFYERADGLLDDLADVRRQTWLLVSGVFLLSLIGLSGIVHAGSKLISSQQSDLRKRLLENTDLKNRISEAAVRSTSQSDRVMQRIGLDLHDGVAQHLSLMALRLDGAGMENTEDADTVRTALSDAMSELRSISRGLALPDIENLDPAKIVERASEDHRKAYGSKVQVNLGDPSSIQLSLPTKIGLYRVAQELLTNAHKHAEAEDIELTLVFEAEHLELAITDDGVGFMPEAQSLRNDGGQGLIGLRDRLLALGGTIDIKSKRGEGTTIKVTLPYGGTST